MKCCWFVLMGFILTAAMTASAQSLDELLDLSPVQPPAESPSTEPTETGDSAEPSATLSDELELELDPEAQRRLTAEAMQDGFEQAVALMQDASDKLVDDADAGLATQRLQQDVIDRLDQLISQMGDSDGSSSSGGSGGASGGTSGQGGSGGAGGAAQQQPAGGQNGQAQAGNTAVRGNGDGDGTRDDTMVSGDPSESLESLRQEWGHLPPRLREQLNEGVAEPFNPMYRRLTERYYRQLAETQAE